MLTRVLVVLSVILAACGGRAAPGGSVTLVRDEARLEARDVEPPPAAAPALPATPFAFPTTVTLEWIRRTADGWLIAGRAQGPVDVDPGEATFRHHGAFLVSVGPGGESRWARAARQVSVNELEELMVVEGERVRFYTDTAEPAFDAALPASTAPHGRLQRGWRTLDGGAVLAFTGYGPRAEHEVIGVARDGRERWRRTIPDLMPTAAGRDRAVLVHAQTSARPLRMVASLLDPADGTMRFEVRLEGTSKVTLRERADGSWWLWAARRASRARIEGRALSLGTAGFALAILDAAGRVLTARAVPMPVRGWGWVDLAPTFLASGDILLTGSFGGEIDVDPNPGVRPLRARDPGFNALIVRMGADLSLRDVWAPGGSVLGAEATEDGGYVLRLRAATAVDLDPREDGFAPASGRSRARFDAEGRLLDAVTFPPGPVRPTSSDVTCMDEVADGPAPSLCRATPVARHASAEAHCASLGDAACASSVCVGRTSCPSLPLRIASPHLGPWIAEAGRDDLVLAVPFADYVRISGEPGVEVRAPDRWGTFVVQRRDLRGRALFSFRPTHPRSDLGGMARAPSGEVVVTWEEAFGSGLGPEGSEGATRWVVRGARLGPDGSVRASWTEPRLRARLVADASRVYGLTSSPTGELSVVATDHDGAVRWTTPISTADRQARVALWEGRLVVVHALMVGGVQGARLTFLDPETGHELSRHEHGGRDDVVLGPGMYFQTEWSAIVARRADGTELWRRELPFALTELRWHGDRLTATGLPRCPPDRPDLRAIICVQAAPRILVLDRDGRELRFGPGAGAVMRIGGELVVAETSGSVSEVELRPLSAERLCADCMGRRFRTEAEWRADFAQ